MRIPGSPQRLAADCVVKARQSGQRAQAEDTLLPGLALEADNPAGCEVPRLPLFASITVRGNVVVRVVEICDTLSLLQCAQTA